MPWLGRTLRAVGGGDNSVAVVRTVILSVLAAARLRACCSPPATRSSATGSSLVLPDVEEGLLLRIFVAVAVTGVVLAAAYLALNPPALAAPAYAARRSTASSGWRRCCSSTRSSCCSSRRRRRRSSVATTTSASATGLTYAEYVHQGFGQLTFATALMLLVVWAASRKAGDTASDQWWLRGSLGALCLLTLVVVASALHRMDLYQDAYGFTRLRLLVDLFEGWLGLVVLGVLVAGIRLRGWWLPRMALLSGAALLLGLAVANPDAWIARAQHRALRDDRQGRLVLPPRAERRRGADAGGRCRPSRPRCALRRPVAREGRLGGLEPLPRTRRRRAGRLRACRAPRSCSEASTRHRDE